MATQKNVSDRSASSGDLDELVSAKQGADYIGVTISTWWEWARTLPDFPKPLRISTRCTRWRRSEVDAFLESRRSM
ncbi:putative transcriptional regulator [Phaeobacter inhibens]|nr:putative transcriptional regulator [Phaeobacter inhibens]